MSAPVSAWNVHKVSHDAAKVSVDVHHHHDDDGGISVHEHDANALGDEAPDGGHDHMPSILLGAFDVPNSSVALTAPVLIRVSFTASPSHGGERHVSEGLRRPPRFG